MGLSPTEQQEYLDKIRSGISSQLNELLKDLEIKFNEKTKTWKDENIKLKTELSDYRNRLRDLTRENNQYQQEKKSAESKYKNLRSGIDKILNDSNSKNQDRIRKLSQQLRDSENDKNALIQQQKKVRTKYIYIIINNNDEKHFVLHKIQTIILKKDKKKHEEFMNELQEKYDKLDRKHRKLKDERDDLISDRDKFKLKSNNLEKILSEQREEENNTNREQLNNAKQELDKLQTAYDKLRGDHNKLDDEYQLILEKYNLEKEAFKKAISNQQIQKHLGDNQHINIADNNREEIRNLRAELTKEFEKQLKDRERQWTKSKNDSIKTLDKEYKELKAAMTHNMKSLENSNKELKNNLIAKDEQIKRLKKENDKLNDLMNKIQELNEKLNNKNAEIMRLKTELSKYKILWNHFFGLDAPLKEEIEKVNNKLDKFENYHNIQSPIPKKKRRVIIESYSQWTKQSQAPLILDTIPSPNDPYQRIELYNMENKVLELRGFKLINQNGNKIPLDQRQINPGQSIGIALKKKKHRFDILYNMMDNNNEEFCKFTDNEVIWLQDSFDEKRQIFPITEIVYDTLVGFGQDPPIQVKKLFTEEENYKGFEFRNIMKKKIKLKDMRFQNKWNTLDKAIPYKTLPRNGVIRLVLTNDRKHPKIKPNDIIVASSSISQQSQDDALYLVDQNGHKIELYNMQGSNFDASQPTLTGTSRSDCFIM